MEWYVFYYDQNKERVVKWNIFDHRAFTEDLKILYSKQYDLNSFSADLQHYAICYFWSKYEYEMFIEPWHNDKAVHKIDVFDQLMMNWDIFARYCYNYQTHERSD